MTRYVKIGPIDNTFAAGTSGGTTPIRVSSVTESIDRGVLFEETIDNYLPTSGFGGALKVSGTIEANFRPSQHAVLINSLLGDLHTISYPLSFPMTIGEQSVGGSLATNFVGCVIKSATLDFVAKDFVKAKYDWLAKTYNAGTFAAPTYSVEDPVVFYDAALQVGGYTTRTKECSLTIDRKIDDERFILGDYTIQEIGFTGLTEVSGTLTFTEQMYSQFLLAIYGDANATSLTDCNKIGPPTLTITCYGNCPKTSRYVITCGVALYDKADVTITGQQTADKKIDFKVIGSAFNMT